MNNKGFAGFSIFVMAVSCVCSPKVAATNKQVLDEGGVHSSGDQKNLAANTITSDKSKKVEASVKTLAEKASNLIGNAEERSKTSSLPFWVRLPQPHHEPAVAQSPMLDVQKRSLDDETSFMAKQSSSVAKNQNIDVEQDIQAETSTTATTAAAMKVPELDKDNPGNTAEDKLQTLDASHKEKDSDNHQKDEQEARSVSVSVEAESHLKTSFDVQQTETDSSDAARVEPTIDLPKDTTSASPPPDIRQTASEESTSEAAPQDAEKGARPDVEPVVSAVEPSSEVHQEGLPDGATTSQSDAVGRDDGEKKAEPSVEGNDEKPDEHVKLEVDSIQSFEEWKKKHIQDREDAAAADVKASAPRTTIRTKKTQMNYASQDCGAKILSHNPEARHISAILDENKDMYMLNPCSASIWFVVELCEPIQIRQLQLANLELFSSAPKRFEISISERYPAREWRPVGAFEARNERALQTFVPTREELMFAKYVKFEMKSHFGTEHFCPLTMLRVLGVSMVEEYEEAEEKEKPDHARDSSDDTEAASLEETSANTSQDAGSIDKVLSLVKNAVGSIWGNGDALHEANATSPENSTAANFSSTSEEEAIDSAWESPVTLVTNGSEVEPPARRPDGPIVTLVETGNGQEIVYEQPVPPLYDLSFLGQLSAQKFSTRLCWFLEFIYRVSVLSCIIQPGGNRTSTSGAFPSLAPNQQIWATAPTSGQTIVSSPSPGDGKTGPDLVLVKSASEKPSAGDSDVAATEEVAKNEGFIGPEAGHEPNAGKSAADKHSYSSLPDVPSLDKDREIAGEQQSSPGVAEEDGLLVPKEPNDTQVGPETEPVAHVRDPASPLLGGVDKCEVAKDPSLVREPEVADSGSPGVPDRNQSGGIHSDPGDQTNATAGVHANPSENTAERSESDEQSEKTAAGKSSDSSDNVTATQQDDDVVLVKKEEPTGDTATQPSVNVDDLVTEEAATAIPPIAGHANGKEPAVVESQVVINPGTNQKESVLMRLSNRIRVLEQNMSLSSAYLEDLSQRYKRQMDELQKAFNRTKTRMADASRKTEEKEQSQDESIAHAHNDTAALREKLDSLQDSMEYLNRQMVARHLCLMAIESVVLIVLTVTCFGARQYRLLKRIADTEREIAALRKSSSFKHANGHVTVSRPIAGDSMDASSVKKSLSATAIRRPLTECTIDSSELASPQLLSSSSSPSLRRSRSLKALRHVNKKRGSGASFAKARKPSSSSSGGCAALSRSSDKSSTHGTFISDFMSGSRPGGKVAGRKGSGGGSRGEKKLAFMTSCDVADAKVFCAGNGFNHNAKFSAKLPTTPGCRSALMPWQPRNTLLSNTFSGKAR